MNYFACTHGNRPGQIYLSINHISFYSYFLGSELKLVFRWIDVEKIELKTTLVAYAVKDRIKPNGRMFETCVFNFFRAKIFFIDLGFYPKKVVTSQDKYSFYFVSEEPYRTMQQLADLACRQLMDGEKVFLTSQYEIFFVIFTKFY